ncbi:MAG: hypothetical protein EXQ91_04060 [Alphaproteobacteria bacterium]|nr:hypothetical protein [Alphaproteobacteria bacterium]
MLPTGVSFCQCRYLQWGFFGYSYGQGGNVRREDANLGVFVAGPLPMPSDIPTTGTATFTGHAIGTVSVNSGTYVAAGGFSNAWNFGARTGTM